MISTTAIVLLYVSPIVAVFAGVQFLAWWQGDRRSRQPLCHPQQRYPGFSLSQQVEKLEGRLLSFLLGLVMLPMLVTLFLLSEEGVVVGSGFRGGLSVVALVTLAILVWKIFRTSHLLLRCRRGLIAEQAVGQQLNELMRDGYHVFHDLCFPGENVDHVVVGPGGIFCIETKYRRKQRRDGNPAKLLYNGRRLKFGKQGVTKPLVQARSQAKRLKALLANVSGNRVVQAVVTYPGWYVEQEKGEVDVLVMNDRRMISYLGRQRTVLSREKIYAIADLLRAHCQQPDIEDVCIDFNRPRIEERKTVAASA